MLLSGTQSFPNKRKGNQLQKRQLTKVQGDNVLIQSFLFPTEKGKERGMCDKMNLIYGYLLLNPKMTYYHPHSTQRRITEIQKG